MSAPIPPSKREDLLTPVHKGIRSMIYSLGTDLQTTDFSDRTASEAMLIKMRHELTAATQATCVMCLLHDHAGTEETGFYPQLNAFEPALVRRMLDQHSKIVQRLVAMAKQWDRLHEESDPGSRVAMGAQILAAANEFFAFYMSHMNEEESEVVPATWRHFSDDQLRAIRGKIMAGFPPQVMRANARWMMPALNVQELSELMAACKQGAPPPLLSLLKDVGQANVDPARWKLVSQRVGL